jgi:organic hydroperoxide reductase OsmC/OhrA
MNAGASETRQIGVTITQQQDYAFQVKFDGSDIPDLLTDESEPLGHDAGPNPARMLLAAVANCLTASLLFALRKFKNQPGQLVTRATATLGRNAEGRIRILGIEADIQLAEPATALASGERLLAQFEQFCTVTESVRAGIPVTVRVTDADGVLVHEGAELV